MEVKREPALVEINGEAETLTEDWGVGMGTKGVTIVE